MDIVFLLFFLLAGIYVFFFSHSKDKFEKTVAIKGEKSAKKLFFLMKLCGYLLLLLAIGRLVVLIFFLD